MYASSFSNGFDTPKVVKIKVDTLEAPDGTDSIVPQDLIDSCKESVMDTLHSAVNFLSGSGVDGGNTTILWTSLVVLASLFLCFYFVWLYRRQIQKKACL